MAVTRWPDVLSSPHDVVCGVHAIRAPGMDRRGDMTPRTVFDVAIAVVRCHGSALGPRVGVVLIRGAGRRPFVPFRDWTAIVKTSGRICYEKVNLSTVFAGQKIGVAHESDHI